MSTHFWPISVSNYLDCPVLWSEDCADWTYVHWWGSLSMRWINSISMCCQPFYALRFTDWTLLWSNFFLKCTFFAIYSSYIFDCHDFTGVEGRILSGKMRSDHKLAFGLLERYNWPTFQCTLSSLYKLIFSSMILQHVKFPFFFHLSHTPICFKKEKFVGCLNLMVYYSPSNELNFKLAKKACANPRPWK